MGLRVISFKLDEDFLEEIDYYSSILGMNRSEFIRQALEKMIDEIKRNLEKEISVREVAIEPVIY